jgi:kynureninase
LKLVEPEEIAGSLTADVAVLMLTHVNYRTGAMHDMAAVTAAAHAAGILTSGTWRTAQVRCRGPDWRAGGFAVGCGYKYLNGGPGAPAFVWVAHPRHADRFWQPLAGWWGHASAV